MPSEPRERTCEFFGLWPGRIYFKKYFKNTRELIFLGLKRRGLQKLIQMEKRRKRSGMHRERVREVESGYSRN